MLSAHDAIIMTGTGLACIIGTAAALGKYIADANWAYREAKRLTSLADAATAAAETIETRYNLLVEPTQTLPILDRNSWRTRWSLFRERFTPVEQAPNWAPGEVLALATLGTDPVHPDPLPPPPPPSLRRQPWDRHVNRAEWPNSTVNPKARRLVARLADLPNPATLAARLSKMPDPTRAYRTARSF